MVGTFKLKKMQEMSEQKDKKEKKGTWGKSKLAILEVRKDYVVCGLFCDGSGR